MKRGLKYVIVDIGQWSSAFRGTAMRRKESDALIGGVLFLAGIVWIFTQGAQFLAGLPSGVWGAGALVILGITITILVKRIVQNFLDVRAGKSAANKASLVIAEHLPALVRRKAQLVRTDAYGKQKLEGWIKEVSYFVDEFIKPQLTPREHLVFIREKQSAILTAIHMRVEQEADKNPAFSAFSDNMTPSEFESFCASELQQAGWSARVTLQSRDQGVDVLAQKGNVRVVLQCKLYARPVGNKAVQEAAAARAHERANFGVVVTNHRYTRDAEHLASTNNILLLHYSDLRNLDSFVRPTSSSEKSWYYDDGMGQVGPLNYSDLRETLSTIENFSDVLVWCSQFPDWKRAGDVPELNFVGGRGRK
ncbi:MAG: restriction endonuclease [Afipia sp.]|nr:restriction endonuclease [Afipia sp.]